MLIHGLSPVDRAPHHTHLATHLPLNVHLDLLHVRHVGQVDLELLGHFLEQLQFDVLHLNLNDSIFILFVFETQSRKNKHEFFEFLQNVIWLANKIDRHEIARIAPQELPVQLLVPLHQADRHHEELLRDYVVTVSVQFNS